MTGYEIAGQTISAVAMVIVTASFQINTKRRLLVVQSISTLMFCISYVFLGDMVGALLNAICLARNFCFYFQRDRSAWHYLTTGVLVGAMIAVVAVFWTGPLNLLAILALGGNTVFLSFGRPQLLRRSILVTSPTMAVYNALIPAWGSFATEILVVISSVVGLLRFRSDNKEKENCDEAVR